MGFRFFRRISIAPGITLNLSKSGGSISLGPRGAKVTLGPKGGRATLGLPGTGISYTTRLPMGGSTGKKPSREPSPSSADEPLDLGFFRRLFTPEEEKAFVEGCRDLSQGRETEALAHFTAAAHLADAAFLAGVLCLKALDAEAASGFLETAMEKEAALGEHFAKYGMAPRLAIPVTAEIEAHVGPDFRGLTLALVEAYQLQDRREEAIGCLERLVEREPEDVLIRLSLAELLMDTADRAVCHRVVALAENLDNASLAHAGLMLYKARALRRMGMAVAARDVLTAALRRTRERPAELLCALRYERAGVYADLGQRAREREDLERIYAEDPDFEDVRLRLDA